MLKRPHELGFVEEHLAEDRKLGLVEELGLDALDDDDTLRTDRVFVAGVLSAKHLGHAAFADALNQKVVTQAWETVPRHCM